MRNRGAARRKVPEGIDQGLTSTSLLNPGGHLKRLVLPRANNGKLKLTEMLPWAFPNLWLKIHPSMMPLNLLPDLMRGTWMGMTGLV